jgi:hypothetical protein
MRIPDINGLSDLSFIRVEGGTARRPRAIRRMSGLPGTVAALQTGLDATGYLA